MNIKHTHRLAIALFLAVLLTTVVVASGDESPFDLTVLLGEWSGSGMFVMPITGIEMDIEGSASFVYDSSGDYIRTNMTGTKLFYTYRDSGHLYINYEKDSLTWEVWDGFGRYVIYEGIGKGDTLTGRRKDGGATYKIMATMVTPDSLNFWLHYVDTHGQQVDMARFNLGRIR
jgi:hypothetical protein